MGKIKENDLPPMKKKIKENLYSFVTLCKTKSALTRAKDYYKNSWTSLKTGSWKDEEGKMWFTLYGWGRK